MKKLLLICCLMMLLCFTGCKGKTEETPTEMLPMDAIEFFNTQETTEATEPTAPPEILTVLNWGAYNGYYLEDGSDSVVENVACVLIQNTSDRYLDYGVINATVGGKNCTFVVTGLPGGASAWVAEETAQTMEEGEEFTYVDQTVSQLKDLPQEDRVEVRFLNGEIELTNQSEGTFSEVRVYYKLLNTDGNYLGGITYTTVSGPIEPGQTITVTAGHSSETNCAIVRVDCME